MKKRILAILIPVVLAVTIAGAAFALNNVALTSSGSLVVADEAGLSFTSGTTLNWTVVGGGPVVKGAAISLTANLLVENDGTSTITNFDATPTTITIGGSDFTLTVDDSALGGGIAYGESATIVFNLTGNAPATAGTYDLSTEIENITLTAS